MLRLYRMCTYRICFSRIGCLSRKLPLVSHLPVTKKYPDPDGSRYFLRKGWDSNPRSVISRTHDFQSCALDQLSHLCVLCPSIESVFLSDSFHIISHPSPFVNPFFNFSEIYFFTCHIPPENQKNMHFIHKNSQKVFTKYTQIWYNNHTETAGTAQTPSPAGTEIKQRW